MKAATRLTTKGQIVIPKRVRAAMRWRAGPQLQIETLTDGSVRLLPTAGGAGPASADPIERGFGYLKEGDPIGDLELEHRAEIEADELRTRRP